jgi:hypothetical protein
METRQMLAKRKLEMTSVPLGLAKKSLKRKQQIS